MNIDLNKEKLDEMNEVLAIQKGSYDYNDYMHGMYNGMEFIVSIAEGREPIFLGALKVYTSEKEKDLK